MIPNINEVKEKGGFEFRFISKDKKVNKTKWIKFVEDLNKFNISYGGPKGIEVNKRFFIYFNEKEQIALLWHEYHHSRIKFFTFGKHCEEFRADKYSALKNSIEDCLRYLKTGKRLYNEEIIKFEPKNHPKIDERIKRIENLVKKK